MRYRILKNVPTCIIFLNEPFYFRFNFVLITRYSKCFIPRIHFNTFSLLCHNILNTSCVRNRFSFYKRCKLSATRETVLIHAKYSFVKIPFNEQRWNNFDIFNYVQLGERIHSLFTFVLILSNPWFVKS